jgi:beta-mannosidase
VVGGRWKPLHYLYRRSIYTDVVATCGGDGTCYIKNDRAGTPFRGTVTLEALSFADGTLATVHVERSSLAAGAGVSHYFHAATIANISGATHMLLATVRDDDSNSAVVSANEILLIPPTGLTLLSAAVTAAVASTANPDGSTNVTVSTNATALYVTLTTLAQGRFNDNFFAMRPGATRVVTFLPFATTRAAAEGGSGNAAGTATAAGAAGGAGAASGGSRMLAESMRVEHLQMYLEG